MKVYIHQYNGQFVDDYLYNAYSGFNALGADIKFFEDIESVPFGNGENVVVTYVEDTIAYLKEYGIEAPKPFNIPDELNNDYFLGRNIEIKTMGEFKANPNLPIFVKPHSQVKEFSSGVVEKQSTIDLAFSDVADDRLVMTSTLVDFVSEYRCFIYKGKLVGMKHYQGAFTVFPSIEPILFAIDEFKSAPIAYTLDFGVVNTVNSGLVSYSTKLIEAQDFWSIGSYGFNNKLYSQMLRDRWFEITRNK